MERAIGLDPRSAEAHANLGNALRRIGRLEAAKTSLRQAVELNPGSADLQINLANVLLELRQFEGVCRMLPARDRARSSSGERLSRPCGQLALLRGHRLCDHAIPSTR